MRVRDTEREERVDGVSALVQKERERNEQDWWEDPEKGAAVDTKEVSGWEDGKAREAKWKGWWEWEQSNVTKVDVDGDDDDDDEVKKRKQKSKKNKANSNL